ncbi:BTAD domain-containing putative transcriptional regulator [Streptomyces hygroscopicus]|uniref:DNA-binding SARP family transcriptional activator n=1 Tax=Streptomyces demainii TaxID=588122 RepID=A0ABT9KHE8_9ACTN|nr:BTAD domain-containing putative transcriptional regulator [Streptomyces demainii]MDP9607830.1 DNA-binding SARP family transcriptional activator [Streptomyces demainii]
MLIRLVGLVSIEHDREAPRVLSSHQAQIALARLCVERPTGIDREQLADTIWPDGPPSTWASALRSVVSRLRSFLSEESPTTSEPHLIARGGRYLLQLPEGAQVDVDRAESAAVSAAAAYRDGDHGTAQRLATTAVSLLRGLFLASHEGEWVDSVRGRLTEVRVSALETASSSFSALGDTHHALRYADEAVRQAPFRESTYRCQMTAHRLAGNRAEALRIYQKLRTVLAEELGIDPSPESEAAYLRLLSSPGPVVPAMVLPHQAMPSHPLS